MITLAGVITASPPLCQAESRVATHPTHALARTTQRICAVLSVSPETSAMTHTRHSGKSEPLMPDPVLAQRPRYTLCPIMQTIPTVIAHRLAQSQGAGNPLFSPTRLLRPWRELRHSQSQLPFGVLCSLSAGTSDIKVEGSASQASVSTPAPVNIPSQIQSQWGPRIYPSDKILSHTRGP